MYPSEEDLQTISSWPYEQYTDLMEYILERWEYSDCGFWNQRNNEYWISTAGWSGNEDIIAAMRENMMFWALCWYSSERGGHYKFIIPEGR